MVISFGTALVICGLFAGVCALIFLCVKAVCGLIKLIILIFVDLLKYIFGKISQVLTRKGGSLGVASAPFNNSVVEVKGGE